MAGSVPKRFDTCKENDDDGEEIFWYFVRVNIEGKTKGYSIIGSGSKIMSGTKKQFSKAIWWGIARRQIAIGPFYSQVEANNSKILYQRSKDKINQLPSGEPPEQIYWFALSFKQLERLGAYQFDRNPAAVASGSSQEFIDFLYDGIAFERLAIGPFWDYVRAEESKAIYRENE